jgi:hypothetical protein
VSQDYREAAMWYRKSAEQGFAIAQKNLGVLYAQGSGVEKNEAEALRWFAAAVEHGLASALLNEAALYMDASEMPRDYGMAERLLSAANAAGDQQAHSLLERCRQLEKASVDSQTATAAQPKSR